MRKKKNWKTPLVLLFKLLHIVLSERQYRLVLGAIVLLGIWEVKEIHEASGTSYSVIYTAAKEVDMIYEDIKKGEGEKHREALSVPRPNNPLKFIYINDESSSTFSTTTTVSEATESSEKDMNEEDKEKGKDDKENVEADALPLLDDFTLQNINSSAIQGICRKPKKRGRKNQGKSKKKSRKKPRDRRNLKGTVGRPPIYEKYPDIIRIILQTICCYVYGDPTTTHLWVSASHDHIRQLLAKSNVFVSNPSVGRLLWALGYSRQKNKKMLPVVKQHPDRNKQFAFIKALREHASKKNNWSIVSIDTKATENIGNTANKGTEYREIGNPRLTDDHDYKDPEKGVIHPYAVYDMKKNEAYVTLGRTYDTPEFAVSCMRRYINGHMFVNHPEADHLLILCDGGGSNGSRCRKWKEGLASLAEEYDLIIVVCHYPPGTSKWNPVEHRVFSEISKGWAARPLLTVAHAVGYIEASGTSTGLTIKCTVDETEYERGKTLTQKQIDQVMNDHIIRTTLCSQWNYIVYKRKPENLEDEILEIEQQVLEELEAEEIKRIDLLMLAAEKAIAYVESLPEDQDHTDLFQRIKSLEDVILKAKDSLDSLIKMSKEVAAVREQIMAKKEVA